MDKIWKVRTCARNFFESVSKLVTTLAVAVVFCEGWGLSDGCKKVKIFKSGCV